jgi:hypothetical protein
LDTGDGSSGIDGSGCSTSVDPSVGPDGCELDDGCAADDSGFAKKWLSPGWPKSLSNSSFKPSPGLGGARSGLDTGDGSSGIDGSGCSTSVHPSVGPDGGELDDGRAADDSSGFAKKCPLGWPKSLSNSAFNLSPGLGGAWFGLDTGDGSSGTDSSGCLRPVHPSASPGWTRRWSIYKIHPMVPVEVRLRVQVCPRPFLRVRLG